MSDYNSHDLPVEGLQKLFTSQAKNVGFRLDVRDNALSALSAHSKEGQSYQVGVFPAGENGTGPMLLTDFLERSQLSADALLGSDAAAQLDLKNYAVELSEAQLRHLVNTMTEWEQEDADQPNQDFATDDFVLA